MECDPPSEVLDVSEIGHPSLAAAEGDPPGEILNVSEVVHSSFGRCLVATRPLRRGDVVMRERPLLAGVPYAELPPLAAFAALPEAAAPMPDDIGAIGGAAWPTQSTFSVSAFGLLLEFAEADGTTRAVVIGEMQHEMERPFGHAGPAEVMAERAEAALRARGAPWLAEEWELPGGVEARGLLARLLRIFAVSAMPWHGGGALYRTASRLAHACHHANTGYDSGRGGHGFGTFTALRPIAQGELITHGYLTTTLSLCSTPLRRRLLYCQRSMLCQCAVCAADDCGGARRPPPSEEALAAEALRLYASVDFERPRALPPPVQRQIAALRPRLEAELGEEHWATQAIRRLVLSATYDEIFHGGTASLLDDGASQQEWQQRMEACEAYVAEALASYAPCPVFLSP